jgi:hypothetical protein
MIRRGPFSFFNVRSLPWGVNAWLGEIVWSTVGSELLFIYKWLVGLVLGDYLELGAHKSGASSVSVISL